MVLSLYLGYLKEVARLQNEHTELKKQSIKSTEVDELD